MRQHQSFIAIKYFRIHSINLNLATERKKRPSNLAVGTKNSYSMNILYSSKGSNDLEMVKSDVLVDEKDAKV